MKSNDHFWRYVDTVRRWRDAAGRCCADSFERGHMWSAGFFAEDYERWNWMYGALTIKTPRLELPHLKGV